MTNSEKLEKDSSLPKPTAKAKKNVSKGWHYSSGNQISPLHSLEGGAWLEKDVPRFWCKTVMLKLKDGSYLSGWSEPLNADADRWFWTTGHGDDITVQVLAWRKIPVNW